MESETQQITEPELLSLHIPKTAGTSFRNILKSVYGEDQVVRFDTKPDGSAELDEVPYEAKVLPAVRVIHGHFRFDKLTALFPLPKNYKSIIWVRDPVDRVISNYYYLDSILRKKLGDDPSNHNILVKMERSLMEYARFRRSQNRQIKFLQGTDISAFDFVGVVEFYADEVKEVARLLNWEDVPEVLYLNKTKTDRPDIPKEWKDEIRSLNKKDMAMYEQALAMREARIQQKK